MLKPVYSSALNYCIGLCRKGNLNEAEDIFQDSLLKALENFTDLFEDDKFKNWLFTIITNTYISFYRKKIFRKFLSIEEYQDIGKLHGLIQENLPGEIHTGLYLALSGIKEKEKISFLLFELGGFSIEEIQKIQMEKSASAVKSRLSRTRKKLKALINKIEKNNFRIKQTELADNLESETLNIINKIKPENQGG
ncbi:MAG: RNA polymerase sigma factor [Ignavibacteriae bacterium]|nr:RNA polymerase sigma factor [Ignavibacteriota bacterium]